MFDMDGDALDGLDMGQLEALAAQMQGAQSRPVTQAGVRPKKLGSVKKPSIRHGFGVDEVGNINETVDIVISLPLHMVIGMEKEGISYREAVRDALAKRGASEWADSRFLISMRGEAMRAKDRFTRRFG